MGLNGIELVCHKKKFDETHKKAFDHETKSYFFYIFQHLLWLQVNLISLRQEITTNKQDSPLLFKRVLMLLPLL
jgi:hypothetical protein